MSNVENNKRIAKNTLYLYFRMAFSMVVSLYSSRLILDILGADDYGIYNVVGGFATSFFFLSSTLSNATQRYFNYEKGLGEKKELNKLFNMVLIIYLCFSIFSIITIETVGLWLIHNKLTISPDRLDAAVWVLHTTSFTLLFTLISSVYESVLISNENMRIYAYMGIYDAISKLLILFPLFFLTIDKLKIYAILLVIVIAIGKMVPTIYTIKKYDETRLRFYWNKKTVIDIFKFSGWNLIGTSVYIFNDYGINILLNLFFGPAINAARAISVNVKNIVVYFTSSYFTAVRPQIVKSYANKDYNYYTSLIINTSKYSFFLLWIICLPIMCNINVLLDFWLKDVPFMTSEFVIWTLIFVLVNSFCDPLWQGMQAIGTLKKYILVGSIIYLLTFPFTWIALDIWHLPIHAFQIIVLIRIVYLISNFIIFKTYVNLSIKRYLHSVIQPVIIVVVSSTMITMLIKNTIIVNSFVSTAFIISMELITTLSIVFFAGISRDERVTVAEAIKNKLCRY